MDTNLVKLALPVSKCQNVPPPEIAAQSSSTPNTAVDHYLSVSALVPLGSSDTLRLSAYNGAAASRSTVESRMSVTRSA